MRTPSDALSDATAAIKSRDTVAMAAFSEEMCGLIFDGEVCDSEVVRMLTMLVSVHAKWVASLDGETECEGGGG